MKIMNSLIVINSDADLKKFKNYENNNNVFLFLNQEKCPSLAAKTRTWKDYVDYDFYSGVGDASLRTVRQWGKIALGDKTLKEALTVDGLPFWEFIEQYLSIRLFISSKKIQYVSILKRAISKEKPDNIVFLNDQSHASLACKAVAKSEGIKTAALGSGRKLGNHKTKAKEMLKMTIYEIKRNLPKKYTKIDLPENGVMVFPSIQTMIPIVKPIIDELEKQKISHYVVKYDLWHDRMGKDLKEKNIDYFDLTSIEDQSNPKIKIIIKTIESVWNNAQKKGDFRQSIKYDGISIWELVADDLELLFPVSFNMSRIVRYTLNMEKLLKKSKPRLIIALDELSAFGLPLATLAKKNNIPLLIIQHGLFWENYTHIYGPSLATKKAVWGPRIKKMLLERKFTKDQLIVTGCPKFDDIFESKNIDIDNVYKKIGLDSNKDTILFAAQPDDESKNAAKILCNSLKHFPEKQLIMKLHPRETNMKYYEQICSNIDDRSFVNRTHDLYELLCATDLVVTTVSTVGLESMMFGKPLITIKVDIAPNPFKACSVEVTTEYQLKEAIKKFNNEAFRGEFTKRAKEYIYDYAYKTDGKSKDRVMKIVHELLGDMNVSKTTR